MVENKPAIDLFKTHDGDQTLWYVDPPYLSETRNVGHDYVHEMTDGDHVDLLMRCRELAGSVIISGYPSPLYEALLDDWTRIERPALADGARPRTEVLWLNTRATSAI